MRIAIIADWLTTFGGAEHVIDSCHQLWPDAPIFTTVVRRAHLGPLAAADIRPDTRLQRIYQLIGRHQVLLPWMPAAMERADLRGYDVVLSSSHAVGKGVIVPCGSIHVCYCHTPMRYAWEMEEEYLRDFGIHGLLRRYVKRELARLRRWDLSSAKRVDVFIANSTETQQRIQRTYGRESVVISPPVSDHFFAVPFEPRTHLSIEPCKQPFLAFGRLVPYKRFDLLIELAHRLQIPLVIAGSGSDEARLRSLAGPTVSFVGRVPDAAVPMLYRRSRALLMPQYEDAGIVPMEAQACGLPVIAYGKGGVLDAVVDGLSGILVQQQSVDAFADGIRRFETMRWEPAAIRQHARQFHESVFKTRMQEAIAMSWQCTRGATSAT